MGIFSRNRTFLIGAVLILVVGALLFGSVIAVRVFAAAGTPALTTVRMPVREMVAMGVRMVLGEALPGLSEPPPHPLLTPSLVVRASTARPSG